MHFLCPFHVCHCLQFFPFGLQLQKKMINDKVFLLCARWPIVAVIGFLAVPAYYSHVDFGNRAIYDPFLEVAKVFGRFMNILLPFVLFTRCPTLHSLLIGVSCRIQNHFYPDQPRRKYGRILFGIPFYAPLLDMIFHHMVYSGVYMICAIVHTVMHIVRQGLYLTPIAWSHAFGYALLGLFFVPMLLSIIFFFSRKYISLLQRFRYEWWFDMHLIGAPFLLLLIGLHVRFTGNPWVIATYVASSSVFVLDRLMGLFLFSRRVHLRLDKKITADESMLDHIHTIEIIGGSPRWRHWMVCGHYVSVLVPAIDKTQRHPFTLTQARTSVDGDKDRLFIRPIKNEWTNDLIMLLDKNFNNDNGVVAHLSCTHNDLSFRI
jgi:hypothetical protein